MRRSTSSSRTPRQLFHRPPAQLPQMRGACNPTRFPCLGIGERLPLCHPCPFPFVSSRGRLDRIPRSSPLGTRGNQARISRRGGGELSPRQTFLPRVTVPPQPFPSSLPPPSPSPTTRAA